MYVLADTTLPWSMAARVTTAGTIVDVATAKAS